MLDSSGQGYYTYAVFVISTLKGDGMAIKKRTSVLLDQALLNRARRLLRVSNNTQAITRALAEAVTNREIDTALTDLLRKGRGRFVDVYR